jgi:AbrB family looped-hinge helix DNA binding protein
MITKVTGKNQVTVPAEIAAKERVKPGTRLDWQLTDEEHTILVRVLPDRGTMASGLRGRGRRHKKRGPRAVANLGREREREDRG